VNKTVSILLAAGKSERFENSVPKPFSFLKGKQIYRYSLDVLMNHPQIDAVYLVIPKNLLIVEKENLKSEPFPKPLHLIAGGQTRFQSVNNALIQLDNSIKNVLIHDTARPIINTKLIDNCLQNLSKNKAISCFIESTDTLVIKDSGGFANSYPERKQVVCIQTPQAFDAKLLVSAYSLALKKGKTDFTDDSSLVHYFNLAPVFLVPGNVQNIKITYPTDILLAELILNGFKS